MKERLQEEGVEVFLKYPGAERPFEDDMEIMIH